MAKDEQKSVVALVKDFKQLKRINKTGVDIHLLKRVRYFEKRMYEDNKINEEEGDKSEED